MIFSSRCRVEQPTECSGELYLTERRLIMIRSSGLLRRRAEVFFDEALQDISLVRSDGILRKAVTLSVRRPQGSVVTYRLKVPSAEVWASHIYTATVGVREPGSTAL